MNQKAPQTNGFVDLGSGIRLSKIAGVFGPNASGKTNILNVLHFIQHFIVHSFHFKGKGFLNYFPYMMNDEGSKFEVGFFIDAVYYVYSFSVDTERVLSEKLQKKSPGLITVFERHGQVFKSPNFDNQNNFTISENQKKNVNFDNRHIQNLFNQMVRPNASVISTFAQINQSEMQRILHFWVNNVIFPWYPDRQNVSGIDHISKGYQQDPDVLSELKNILDNLDIGEHKLSFETTPIVDSVTKKPRSLLLPIVTRYNSKLKQEYRIYLANESHGVFNLFPKLFFILKGIKEGALIAIDELESGIHPQAVSRILHLFMEKSNKKGQILFTTHMTPILMDLNKYQVYLTEKNKYNESEVFRLDQVEGVRPEDNLFKKYMAGIYGGFPDIDF